MKVQNEAISPKKVLYLSNIEVPYRVRLFNELAKHCELTVLYERSSSFNRDQKWCQSEEHKFNVQFLDGMRIGNENSFSLRILKYIFLEYDHIIIGCYNSKVQMMAMLVMRLLRKNYILNIDGEIFLSKRDIKTVLKRFFLRGAAGYLAAGEKSAMSLREVVTDKPITVYNFSSLCKDEIRERAVEKNQRNKTILVVGQYYDYKGLDVAARVARMDPEYEYLFVGMGKRTELFIKEQRLDELRNVEIIPFLNIQKLNEMYRKCMMLILPSRQECWGLVINEAASFGMPVVSTWGSGAAVEFISEKYPQYLANPGDVESLLSAVNRLKQDRNREIYGQYLREKSSLYSIEKSAEKHIEALK